MKLFKASIQFSILAFCLFFQTSFSTTVTHTYQPSTENIANPERGFYVQDEISKSVLKKYRDSLSITIIRTNFRLDSYRTTDIPKSFLDKMDSDFSVAREAGAKVIPRFAYNFAIGDDDASLVQIQSHLKQLEPILRKNSDVIAFMEAGFIGAWGEWHSSTHGLDITENRKEVLTSVLSSLPKERMVAVRCNLYKREIFGTDLPLTKEEAFNGSDRSRTGAHNDCLGASNTDWGTYSYSSDTVKQSTIINSEKTFLNLDNRFVPQGGETCNPSDYSHCKNIVADLKQMRWDALNINYHEAVLDTLRAEGCFESIQKNLGYRIRLLNAKFDDSVQLGGTFNFTASITNEGWGKIYNPRGVELVIRNSISGSVYYVPIKTDPRFWQSGDTNSITIAVGIPKELTVGSYDLFLNLPDTNAVLHDRPAYSIQLANVNTWEGKTGFNSLQAKVTITAANGGATNTSDPVFILWGTKPLGVLGKSTNFYGVKTSKIKSTDFSTEVFFHGEMSIKANGKRVQN